jgi:hypothetical protein
MTDNLKQAYDIAIKMYNSRLDELETEVKVKNVIIILMLGVIAFLLLK